MNRRHLLASILMIFPVSALCGEIEHAMGRADVPDDPQRIVVLTNEATEAVLALGESPVGAVSSWYGDPWYPHLGHRMDGVEPLGTELAVNLELVAAMEPDLIIGSRKRHEEIFPQLSAIAPTVFTVDNRDWRANLRLFGRALDAEDAATALLDGYAADVAALRDALGDRAGDIVSVVRFVPGQLYLYQQDSFSGVVLADIGFARPPAQAQDGLAMAVGRESIPDMDANRLFHLTYEPGTGEGDALAEKTLADPLWRQLPAVAEGRVHAVDDGVWATAGGYFAARTMLRDIAEIYGVSPDFATDETTTEKDQPA